MIFAGECLCSGPTLAGPSSYAPSSLGWSGSLSQYLPELTPKGDMIETRYGTCFVTAAELLPESGMHAGMFVARLPG
jgi:hypothetical protein